MVGRRKMKISSWCLRKRAKGAAEGVGGDGAGGGVAGNVTIAATYSAAAAAVPRNVSGNWKEGAVFG